MRLYLSIVPFLILGAACLADDSRAGLDLPAIEIFVIEPTVIENVNIWVPAARSGPFINRSCRFKENLAFSSILPASVKHRKTNSCPDQTARILAELTSFYHSQSLPLTIFNGWQWEYTYNMCQYESVSYDLAQRGGCWENGWEAILNLSWGTSRMQILELESLEKFSICKVAPSESIIEVKTFSSMRTRDGYPKERQL
ncbi:MAG: hypothetical protein ACYS9Y_03345 [Planctomycetota bacterium]|jgi:hypothetical protein